MTILFRRAGLAVATAACIATASLAPASAQPSPMSTTPQHLSAAAATTTTPQPDRPATDKNSTAGRKEHSHPSYFDIGGKIFGRHDGIFLGLPPFNGGGSTAGRIYASSVFSGREIRRRGSSGIVNRKDANALVWGPTTRGQFYGCKETLKKDYAQFLADHRAPKGGNSPAYIIRLVPIECPEAPVTGADWLASILHWIVSLITLPFTVLS